VTEDQVRRLDELDSCLGQPGDFGLDVVHAQVDQRGRGVHVQQQPGAGQVEEQQAGWIESGGREGTEQLRVELRSPIEVRGPLRHLHQHDRVSVRSTPL